MSARPERGFSTEEGFLVVAHRGASAIEAENTLPAFDLAILAGADAVEFDVRLTKDGHAVVMHDATVDRTTDGTGPLAELALRDVKKLRIRSSSGEALEVPTLEETLAHLSGRVGVDIEIKADASEPQRVVDAIVHEIRAAGSVGPFLFTSFDPVSLACLRSVDPAFLTGLLSVDAVPMELALEAALAAGHGWILPSAAALTHAGIETVAEAHASGTLVGTWVVDDPARAEAMVALGVDAIATNDPRVIAGVRDAIG